VGTAGYQVRNARPGLAELAAEGIVGADPAFTVLTGDSAALLDSLGGGPP
jgi:hypothetical protein